MRCSVEPMQFENKKNLEEALRKVHQDIGEYPTPIPGCDVQFNHLLEKRTELERKLKAFQNKVIKMWKGENFY